MSTSVFGVNCDYDTGYSGDDSWRMFGQKFPHIQDLELYIQRKCMQFVHFYTVKG